jgi:hypothetical protein
MIVGGFNGTSGGDMNPQDLMQSILLGNLGNFGNHTERFSPSSLGSAATGAAASASATGTAPSDAQLSWAEAAQLPTPRGFIAAAASNGTLFVVGGYNALTGNDSALVEAMLISDASSGPLAWRECSA